MREWSVSAYTPFVLALPPIILAAAAAAAYPLFLLGKKAGGTILLAVGVAVAVCFITLPGGRDLLSRADVLPERPQRIQCFVEAVSKGAPFISSAPQKAESCSFDGRGFSRLGDRAEAEAMARNTRILAP